MTDPWAVQLAKSVENIQKNPDNSENQSNDSEKEGFEDNFLPAEDFNAVDHRPTLPDSKEYLESLEKRLKRIRRDSSILRQLTERREECIRNLLNDNLRLNRDEDFALDAPVNSSSGLLTGVVVPEIYRHLCPIQPISVGETVHIVKHDQLEEERHQQAEQEDVIGDESASETASR